LEHFLITNIISINTHFRVRNFEVLLKWYHNDNHTLKTTYYVQRSRSGNNCPHYTQLSKHFGHFGA
jgi:hypothetical protein